MSKRVVILGLSNFGMFLARYLQPQDVELLVVDRDEARIDSVKESCDRPVIGDATNRDLLEELNIDEADHVVISLGGLEVSIICLLHVRELGARHITVQASSPDHAQVLQLLHVDEVVFPERDVALMYAQQIIHPDVLDVTPLSDQESLVRVRVPSRFHDRRLGDLSLAEDYGITPLLVRRALEDSFQMPDPAHRIRANDVFVLKGRNEDLIRFEKLLPEDRDGEEEAT